MRTSQLLPVVFCLGAGALLGLILVCNRQALLVSEEDKKHSSAQNGEQSFVNHMSVEFRTRGKNQGADLTFSRQSLDSSINGLPEAEVFVPPHDKDRKNTKAIMAIDESLEEDAQDESVSSEEELSHSDEITDDVQESTTGDGLQDTKDHLGRNNDKISEERFAQELEDIYSSEDDFENPMSLSKLANSMSRH